MARIIELEIKRFRGIKYYSGKFSGDLVCLLDAGKQIVKSAMPFVPTIPLVLPFLVSDIKLQKNAYE